MPSQPLPQFLYGVEFGSLGRPNAFPGNSQGDDHLAHRVWSAPVEKILAKIAKCKEALDAPH